MAVGEFDKDFGYLMPFLDKVISSADSISDSAARQELTALIAGEKSRWLRIRQLLSGNAGGPQVKRRQPDIHSNESIQASESPTRPEWQFTVGSLKSR